GTATGKHVHDHHGKNKQYQQLPHGHLVRYLYNFIGRCNIEPKVQRTDSKYSHDVTATLLTLVVMLTTAQLTSAKQSTQTCRNGNQGCSHDFYSEGIVRIRHTKKTDSQR